MRAPMQRAARQRSACRSRRVECSSWTNVMSTAALTTNELTYILGGASDTWGRSRTLSRKLLDAGISGFVSQTCPAHLRGFSLTGLP